MYVSVEEAIAEGAEGSPSRIKKAIMLAQAYIEKMTGQWFELRNKTLYFGGKNQKTLFLPIFVYSISQLLINDSEVDADNYILYNSILLPDDRNNPKIVFDYNISKGTRNIAITGDVGYIDDDESTPVLIKNICIKLALNHILPLSDPERSDGIDRSRIIKETTDGHSYELGQLASAGGYTGDPEIDAVLRSHQAPIKIGAV